MARGRVTYPELADPRKTEYTAKLQHSQDNGICPFGSQRADPEIWGGPKVFVTSNGYYLGQSQFPLYGLDKQHCLLGISEEHQVGPTAITPETFGAYHDMYRHITEGLGLTVAGFGQRIDKLGGVTVAHNHGQFLCRASDTPIPYPPLEFVFSSFQQGQSKRSINTGLVDGNGGCLACNLLAEAGADTSAGGHALVINPFPRTDVLGGSPDLSLLIISKSHTSLGDMDRKAWMARGDTFQEAVNMYGITGGALLEWTGDGEVAQPHAVIEIVMPRLNPDMENGSGAALVYHLGSVSYAH